MAKSKNDRDPLLDELEERILEGNVIFTPDEDFLRRVAESEEKNEDLWHLKKCPLMIEFVLHSIIISISNKGVPTYDQNQSHRQRTTGT